MTPNSAFWLMVAVLSCIASWFFITRVALPFVLDSNHHTRFADIIVMGFGGAVLVIGLVLVLWAGVYFTDMADKYSIVSPNTIVKGLMPVKVVEK